MTSWMRNQMTNLYNFLSAPMIATIALPKKVLYYYITE